MNNKQTKRFRFSIIIPLEFHRGQVEECLERWVSGQTFPRDRYEIVAAGCRSSLGEEALSTLKAILGAHDRLLFFDEPHDMALCAHAAHQANGEILFFTESHCLPEPDILSVAEDALVRHPEWAGFSCQSLPITHNPLSVVEADMYGVDIRYGMEEHPWRKILDQAFVVREESYHSADGFDPKFGHFAEWHLAARMHQQGFQIGYVPEAKFHHYYVGDIHELIEFSRDFVYGEMVYHSNFAYDLLVGYFQEPDEWQMRFNWLSDLVHKISRLARQARSKPGWSFSKLGETIAHFNLLFQLKLRSEYGIAPFIKWAQFRFWVVNWGLRLSLLFRAKKRLVRFFFLRLISTTIKLERLHFVQGWLADKTIENVLASVSTVTSATLKPNRPYPFCLGIHATEEWKEQQFQWSEPLGAIYLSLLPGKYSFELEWLPIKNINNLKVYLDEKTLDSTTQGCKSHGYFEVGSTNPVCFSWTCAPSTFPKGRVLGLPLTSISIIPSI